MPPPPFDINRPYRPLRPSPSSSAPLKRSRAASAPCETEEARQRKRSRGIAFMNENILEEPAYEEPSRDANVSRRSKGKQKEVQSPSPAPPSVLGGGVTAGVIEELAQELKCGCCTELCYNPVIVNPCQHFFCGSCCILWVRNGGANCPACRGVSTSVTPSRVLQSMIDLLLRSDPSRARTVNERAQADQVYKVGTSLRLPTPRPVTPEPNLESPNDNFARPCPTCLAGNPYGWRCPIPIQDPAVDPENAFDLDDGTPPGHAFCGNCDQLHNIQAPPSTKCDFCQVSFCGIGIQGRCCALSLLSQQPHGMTELPDIILSGAIYESFHGNFVEVDILVDYLRANEITLRAVYKEIVTYTLQQPNSFMPLIDSGVFDDVHGIAGGDDPDPSAPRRRVCRLCAAQLLIHSLRDWWIRERRNGNLPEDVLKRKDCPQGNSCDKQSDTAHCKEFNHVIAIPTTSPADQPSAHEPLNALPLLHRSPPTEATHPLGLFFQESNMDMPPPSPPTPTPTQPSHAGASFSSPLFSLPSMAVNEQEQRIESQSHENLNNNSTRADDVRAGGLHLNGQVTWSRAGPSGGEFHNSNGESSSSAPAILPGVSSGPSAPNTMSVAANYGPS